MVVGVVVEGKVEEKGTLVVVRNWSMVHKSCILLQHPVQRRGMELVVGGVVGLGGSLRSGWMHSFVAADFHDTDLTTLLVGSRNVAVVVEGVVADTKV